MERETAVAHRTATLMISPSIQYPLVHRRVMGPDEIMKADYMERDPQGQACQL